MDEGKFVADFVAANVDKIWDIAKDTYGKLNQAAKIKLKSEYTNYLSSTREKYSKSRSFFIRNQSVDLYSYYVPTGIACGDNVIHNPTYYGCTHHTKRMVITGTGGCGKSVLVKHLFLDCIKDQSQVPILIELRDINGTECDLISFIIKTLDNYGLNVTDEYLSKAMKEGHFALFLDGYDEVDFSLRKKLVSQIKTMSTKYKMCSIFVSSRPDDVLDGIDEFSVYSVLPLTLDTASSLINKLPYDENVKNKFIYDLSDGLFEKHESFLSNPLLLSIMLLTYGENAEIPGKLSIFYNQAFEALFQRHDANKGGYCRDRLTDLDIQDFGNVFSVFSLQTYEKRKFKMPRSECLEYIDKSKKLINKEFKPEDYLGDCLSAACLLIEDGLDIGFSHRSFQEYFVARHISMSPPEMQHKLVDRYWKNMRSDKVMCLLLEINPEIVERTLILPVLDKYFKNIGVKNKVGITHAAKFIKNQFSEIYVCHDAIRATYKSRNASEADVIRMLIMHCDAYTYPEKEYFEKRNKVMHKKYSGQSEEVRFMTKDLTHRSPVLVDMLSGKGGLTIEYLSAAYSAYKSLKNKHDQSEQNLDELLGL